ncbi:GDP-mannose pyrophosphorylase [Helicobacter mustelae]|uniref:mannose-1-phosphate guanylyltransferase/mannose-6-phosphate isomerase n=1 Tax=Helicobacter mustelae TaxID=217 RepID=UPI000E06AEEE|nr:mannose-1-phosphate guanylyltransferase/mannose-6-phosphate isomerase [Helicobacter mustelae]STP13211.1 GDP-mannose pyrophosphorylase [Helicobacter mustelae]
MLRIVILCGGSGTRLWPLSRENFPKQFHKLFGESSLFQKTLLRNLPLKNLYTDAKIEVVSNEQYYFLLQNQSAEIGVEISSFICESVSKNTAAAIAFSAFHAKPSDILLVLPSDHLILDSKSYLEHIHKAIEIAQNGYLLTFGITPKEPHTGYGYIQSHQGIVKKFIEKPDLKHAKEYYKAGDFYWNSGMFCFQAKVFLQELECYAKNIYDHAKEAYLHARKDSPGVLVLPKEQSQKIPSNSIDYAVLEKSSRVYCLASDFSWNDVGSFDSLQSCVENTPIVTESSSNNFVLANKLVAMIDVEDLIVIDTQDSMLIAKKGSSQKVKNILPKIKQVAPELTQNHQFTYRPWGSYQVLLETPTYKIKQIVVKPQSRLSLQKHFHRNEHWIIVSGTAQITLESDTFALHPNQSTYIPMGKTHRLANLGKIDLVVIEVQIGEYLGEDDIVRIEDDFSRK